MGSGGISDARVNVTPFSRSTQLPRSIIIPPGLKQGAAMLNVCRQRSSALYVRQGAQVREFALFLLDAKLLQANIRKLRTLSVARRTPHSANRRSFLM